MDMIKPHSDFVSRSFSKAKVPSCNVFILIIRNFALGLIPHEHLREIKSIFSTSISLYATYVHV